MANYIDLIQALNANDVVKVEFTKMDGTLRKMLCTWGEDGAVEATNVVVYDVEVEGYRRIRNNSVKKVEFV